MKNILLIVMMGMSVITYSQTNRRKSFDINLNTLLYEKFELGASYRLDDSYSALVGFQVNPNIRIGYAYDHIVSDIKAIAGSSHEIILTWDVYFNKRALRSPRYF